MTASLAVLVSGGGRTFANLVEQIEAGKLPARISVLVSTNPDSPALALAQSKGIRSEVVLFPSKSSSAASAHDRIYDACVGADLMVMAGFLRHLPVRKEWEGRIVNIHPSLLPRHGGKGMYGHHVHEAVIRQGDRESGCTVHLVDDQFDHGTILGQARVPVLEGDTPESLAARVFEAEKVLYPRILRELIAL
ncbi:MAG: phosphoribosylglycinamide formyltransferase [Planctomycetota bacterium]